MTRHFFDKNRPLYVPDGKCANCAFNPVIYGDRSVRNGLFICGECLAMFEDYRLWLEDYAEPQGYCDQRLLRDMEEVRWYNGFLDHDVFEEWMQDFVCHFDAQKPRYAMSRWMERALATQAPVPERTSQEVESNVQECADMALHIVRNLKLHK